MLRFHRFVNPHNAPSQSRVRTVFEYLVIIFGIFPMALRLRRRRTDGYLLRDLLCHRRTLPLALSRIRGGGSGLADDFRVQRYTAFDSRSHGRLAVLHPDDGRRCGNHVLVPRDTYPA